MVAAEATGRTEWRVGPRCWEVKAAVGRGPVAVGGLSPEPRVVRCMVGQALLAMPWALPLSDSHFSSVEVGNAYCSFGEIAFVFLSKKRRRGNRIRFREVTLD